MDEEFRYIRRVKVTALFVDSFNRIYAVNSIPGQNLQVNEMVYFPYIKKRVEAHETGASRSKSVKAELN